ncbi:alpha/beta fold hydrolase [Paractinoplanes atraurantiacus]|uniref:Lysophospholipase, alpha-beta hydrolase superfamily n=1 Tax=Paractinoplanes atraurantiacus TaxID=1036182 RepID=A0A285KVC7_9ACTN|nr:alpha/beta fold hydrolase [Actinoplanes atraurantiacus]SNY75171.1 Lysophospholipase, alpha-beta hydrolase superfamily [Actinoplanes atraurantiacus]
MHPALRRLALAATIILGVSLLSAPANAAVLAGTVLTNATATLPAELSPLATGKRISYVTTNVNGGVITATGLVLTPKTGKNNKTVAWGHGTTGLADQCSPSASQSVFWPEARAAIAELLRRGWTVAAPDYPGLGTPTSHPYLIGNSEARSIIDSVKAARRLDTALTTQYVVDGHSQGGQGALFVNQIAPSYDSPLVLRGTAAIAPVSNADLFAPVIPGTAGQGYLVMGLYGLQTVDASVNPNTLLAPPAREKVSVLQSGCLYQILDAFAPLTAEQLLVGGALPDAVVTKLARYLNPGQTATSAPVLLVQGTADEAVPYIFTSGPLRSQLGAYSQPVTYTELDGATHDGAVFQSTTLVADWIAARFA